MVVKRIIDREVTTTNKRTGEVRTTRCVLAMVERPDGWWPYHEPLCKRWLQQDLEIYLESEGER